MSSGSGRRCLGSAVSRWRYPGHRPGAGAGPSQPKAARWHQLIEAVRLQKILHLVDRDREPNPCGVRESHANHADGKPVSIDDRTTAVSWIHAVGDLQVSSLARVIGPQRRDCARRRADVRHEIRGCRDLSDFDIAAKRVAERIHGEPGHDGIGVAERNVRKIRPTDEEDRKVQRGI